MPDSGWGGVVEVGNTFGLTVEVEIKLQEVNNISHTDKSGKTTRFIR